MRFILNNKEFVIKCFFPIIFLSIISCSDKDVKPFVGKKIDIHTSSNSITSSKFVIKIDQVVDKYNWSQKGGADNHLIPNINLKFPLKEVFSQDTDQEISDEYYSLANPVVDEKNIYLLSTNGKVLSINKNNFKVNWHKQVFPYQSKFPNLGSIVVQLSSNNLYVHNGGDLIFALNKKNGKVTSKFRNQYPFRGSIAIKNNHILVNDYNNNLLAFLKNKLIWKKKLGQSENSIFSNIRPIIHDDKVINPAFNGLFHILRINDGKLIFSDYLQPNKKLAEIYRNNDIISNPITSNNRMYIISHSGTLASYDLNNLQLLWSVQIGGINTPIISGNSLFVLDNKNTLYGINAQSGEIKWMKQLDVNFEEGFYFKNTIKINFKGPFLIDSKLTLFSSNGFLNFIDPYKGDILEKRKFHHLGAEPIFVKNKLIIITSDGDLKVFK